MAVAKRKTAKKPAAKKSAASIKVKKVSAKKASSKPKKVSAKKSEMPKLVKITSPSKPHTQSEFVQALTNSTGIARKDVKCLLEQLRAIIEAHLCKGGPCVFTLPGLLKMTVQTKPATKARKGVNPFTGEEMTFKAKPARKVVKIKALKKLKALV